VVGLEGVLFGGHDGELGWSSLPCAIVVFGVENRGERLVDSVDLGHLR
jgi:hypothetical protein